MTTAVPQPKCSWCGNGGHESMHCPRVRAFELNPDNTVKRVEFMPTDEQLAFLARCERLLTEVRETMLTLGHLPIRARRQDE